MKKYEPKVLNTINNSKADIDRVKMGLKMVTSTGGTAAGSFGQHDVAGKTGTTKPFTMVLTAAGGEMPRTI